MWLSKVLVNFLLYEMNSPEPQTRLFSSSPWSSAGCVLTLKDWSTHCNTPDERGGWGRSGGRSGGGCWCQDFQPGAGSWLRTREPLVWSFSVWRMSCGHGTKFNKSQIGVNYKAIDLMQEKIPTKLCKHNGITWSTNFFCYGSAESSAFGCGTEEWCIQKGFR